MLAQLARPENQLLGPDLYNQIFTVHGTTMMFLFAVPVMEAVGLYLVPLMVGTRNVAFPRLNALGYYCYLFAGLLLWVTTLAVASSVVLLWAGLAPYRESLKRLRQWGMDARQDDVPGTAQMSS